MPKRMEYIYIYIYISRVEKGSPCNALADIVVSIFCAGSFFAFFGTVAGRLPEHTCGDEFQLFRDDPESVSPLESIFWDVPPYNILTVLDRDYRTPYFNPG